LKINFQFFIHYKSFFMKNSFLTLFLAIFIGLGLKAETPLPDEGMWLPMFVDRLNWTDIQEMGLQLTPEELYSINNSSLKDAVVGLAAGSAPNGYFCTGEIVSDKGLMLTNHHCAYDIIQSQSSVENDYLTDGFWAMSLEEELPNPGITASFLVRMEDLNSVILPELTEEMTGAERSAKVRELTKDIKEQASQDGKYDVVVKSFFGGNEYYMFVYETFKDVRLVGTPPESIGKYGGDTDNWMWPRHTGDFAVLRVYTAPDGSPAEYSEDNIPLKPRHHLPISLKGVEKDDFAMIWGFPGSTERYLTSAGIEFAINEKNPAIVEIFGAVLEQMKIHMDADDAIRIKYASDYASMANGWKYFIGQTRGLKRLDVKSKKAAIENDFDNWVNKNSGRKEKYGNTIGKITAGYDEMEAVVKQVYYSSIGMGRIQLLSNTGQAAQLESLLEDAKNNKTAIGISVESITGELPELFEDFDREMDMDITKVILSVYKKNLATDQLPTVFEIINADFDGDINAYVDDLYEESMFASEESMMKFLKKPKLKKLQKDPAFILSNSLRDVLMENRVAFMNGQNKVDDGMRLFIDGLRKMNPDTKYYPDANSSLRFTYGSVQDYYPADAVHYNYVTHLFGVMEKEDPGSDEFIVPEKLKQLYEAKDYGDYGVDGKLIVCFLSTNDITGGNSGSPVMNGNGELIGIAFDGNWEAMSGDIAFEPELQRTINVDIRYVLFVIDKFAGAQHLIDEMTIVK
jgi:hypothetical protein